VWLIGVPESKTLFERVSFGITWKHSEHLMTILKGLSENDFQVAETLEYVFKVRRRR
jgi:hypothetical protein